MSAYQILSGHVLDVLETLPDESVDCVITSPPYYSLRDYSTSVQTWDGDPACHHNFKSKSRKVGPGSFKDSPIGNNKKGLSSFVINEGFCSKCGAWRGSLGQEPSPQLFVKHLADIFDEVKRVLKPGGTLWVNLNDTYGGSNCGYGQTEESSGFQNVKRQTYYPTSKKSSIVSKIKPKSLLGIPELFVTEMVYNRGWIRRNTIIWFKKNIAPESCRDRFTRDFEFLYFFTKSRHYFFEQQFEPYQDSTFQRAKHGIESAKTSKGIHSGMTIDSQRKAFKKILENPSIGRNHRTVWLINNESSNYDYCIKCDLLFAGSDRKKVIKRKFKKSGRTIVKKYCPNCNSSKHWIEHFASFPKKLCEVPIKAGSPESFCTKCGKPKEKIFKFNGKYVRQGGYGSRTADHLHTGNTSSLRTKKVRQKTFNGYERCKCGAPFLPGVVLDPFMGSGTTLLVGLELGRQVIGIELNPDYCKLAEARIKDQMAKGSKNQKMGVTTIFDTSRKSLGDNKIGNGTKRVK